MEIDTSYYINVVTLLQDSGTSMRRVALVLHGVLGEDLIC